MYTREKVIRAVRASVRTRVCIRTLLPARIRARVRPPIAAASFTLPAPEAPPPYSSPISTNRKSNVSKRASFRRPVTLLRAAT